MPKANGSLSRHPVDVAVARENIGHGTRLLEGLLAPSPGAPEFYLIAQAGFKLAGNGAVAGMDLPAICRGLQIAAKTLSGLFALAAGQGELEVDVGDHVPRRLPASGPTSFTHCGNWLDGFYAACICRERAALDILACTPIEILRKSSSLSDEAYYLLVEGLQALWLGREDTGAKLLASLKATDPAKLKMSSEEAVLDLLVPALDMASHLADGNEQLFNKATCYAIERHKKYWSKGDRKRQSVGFLAIAPLGLASLAHDRGLKITVDSEYLPKPLWQGACAVQ
jgi:hypothetical protein